MDDSVMPISRQVCRVQPSADAVERAVSRHHDALLTFLGWKLGRDDDGVQDALQETYARLLHYRNSDWGELSRSLILRIASSVIVDRARHNASRRSYSHVQMDGLDFESGEANPERSASAQEEVSLVRAAIREMPARCQEVFLLSRIKDMSYAQIAAHLSISIKAVEKHVSRGLAICREKIGEQR